MVRQRYDPNQSSLCSINNVSENFDYGSSINHYRSHHKNKITPVYEEPEVEYDTCNHYTEIRFNDEEQSDKELLDFKTELELFNENPSSQKESYSEQKEDRQEVETDSPIEYGKIFLAKNTISDNTEIAKKSPDPSKVEDGKELIEKLMSFACEVDLNTELLCQEQLKDPVLQKMRSENNKKEKNIEHRQSKAIMSYISKFAKLCFVGNLLCIQESSDDTDIEFLKICVPLSLFSKVFRYYQDMLVLTKLLLKLNNFSIAPVCINGLKS